MSTKRDRLLTMIEQIKTHAADIPEELFNKLQQAEATLQHQSEEEVDLLTNNVVTSPPTERKFDATNPEYVLQSSYREIERLSRKDGANPELEKVVTVMQQYFNIEEKDGYFP